MREKCTDEKGEFNLLQSDYLPIPIHKSRIGELGHTQKSSSYERIMEKSFFDFFSGQSCLYWFAVWHCLSRLRKKIQLRDVDHSLNSIQVQSKPLRD